MGILGALAMVLNGQHSDRAGERYLHLAVPVFLIAAAFLVGGLTASPLVALPAYAAIFIGFNATGGPSWAIPSSFLTGKDAAAGIATANASPLWVELSVPIGWGCQGSDGELPDGPADAGPAHARGGGHRAVDAARGAARSFVAPTFLFRSALRHEADARLGRCPPKRRAGATQPGRHSQGDALRHRFFVDDHPRGAELFASMEKRAAKNSPAGA